MEDGASRDGFDAVVLAGGAARRLDGADKPGLSLGGTSLLARAVAAADGAGHTVVVGPRRGVPRPVLWCRESPPGGGPVAALAAGVTHTDAGAILVLAADLPWVGGAVPLLLTALSAPPGHDAALLVDSGGRVNHLAAVWRRTSLLTALARLGEVAGAPMRALVEQVDVVQVRDTGGWGLDCDTWDDVRAARQALAGHEPAEPSTARAGR